MHVPGVSWRFTLDLQTQHAVCQIHTADTLCFYGKWANAVNGMMNVCVSNVYILNIYKVFQGSRTVLTAPAY